MPSAELEALALALAEARHNVVNAFAATEHAKIALTEAHTRQLAATLRVQELESAVTRAFREVVGPIQRRRTLELANARYTKSDARV